MNRMHGFTWAVLWVAVSGLAMGCAGKSTEAGGTAAAATTTAASATAMASGLYSSLGGATGVQALANSFGAKLALNPTVTKFLDAAAIDAAKGGLTNSIAALSGMAVPSGSADLASVLSSKGVDAAGLAGVGQSLMEAGKELNLKPDQLAGLTGLMDTVSKSVMAGK